MGLILSSCILFLNQFSLMCLKHFSLKGADQIKQVLTWTCMSPGSRVILIHFIVTQEDPSPVRKP